jgi:Holliday junction resolvase RusA-like endonuclease
MQIEPWWSSKIADHSLAKSVLTKFEFIVDGPPVSQQTRRRERLKEWKIVVRQEAEKYWSSEQKIATGPVMLKITYFYDSVGMDVDNIVKPIQDAMIGLAYIDDDQITDVLVRKRDLSGNFRVEDITPTLAEGFARENEFLHIVVVNASDQQVLI